MKRIFALSLTLLTTFPGAVLALSCARPDMARSYLAAHEASDSYIVALGEIDYPVRAGPKPAKGESRIARLRARGITRTGFSAWIDEDITVQPTCAGPWCGSVPEGERLLIFLRQTTQGYVIDADPCSQFVFANPGQAEMRILRGCLSGGTCKPRYR